jgi:hypothetical protein
MNVNVYLPDDLGRRAKAADLPFSQLLQSAVFDELERRAAMSATLNEPQTYEVAIEDRDGGAYTGRITGKEIASGEDRHGNLTQIFLTEDERVLIYDGARMEYSELDFPAQLEDWQHDLEPAVYAEAMAALGLKATIDL